LCSPSTLNFPILTLAFTSLAANSTYESSMACEFKKWKSKKKEMKLGYV
jgi:hypothetical protein